MNYKYIFLIPFILINIVFAETFIDENEIPDYAKTAITELYNKQIITGNSDNTIRPMAFVNRAEFIKLMILATNTELNPSTTKPFNDVNGDEWYAPYALTGHKLGWINGFPDGSFRASEMVNRAQVAKIISIALGESLRTPSEGAPWYDIYFYRIDDSKLMAYGTDLSTAEASKTPTRAELMEQLYRFMIRKGYITMKHNMPIEEKDMSITKARLNDFMQGCEKVKIDSEATSNDIIRTSKTEEYTAGCPKLWKMMFESSPFKTLEERDTMLEKLMIHFEMNGENTDFSSYIEPHPLPYPLSATAGKLIITPSIEQPKGLYLQDNNENNTLFVFDVSSDMPTKISTIRYKLLGDGAISHFKKLWIEVDDKVYSDILAPMKLDNTIDITLSAPLITTYTPRKIALKGILYDNVEAFDGRFIVYNSDWIATDTRTIEADFPLIGADMHYRNRTEGDTNTPIDTDDEEVVDTPPSA